MNKTPESERANVVKVKILREHKDGGSIEAIRSGIKFILTSVVPRRCDSDGVSDCVRCQSVYLARTFQSVIDELSEPTPEAAENPPAPPEANEGQTTNPNEPTLTCSEVVERLHAECVSYSPMRETEFDTAKAEAILHSWREQIKKELK